MFILSLPGLGADYGNHQTIRNRNANISELEFELGPSEILVGPN